MSKGLLKTCDEIEGIVGSAKFKSGEYLDEILNPYAVSSTVCSRCHNRVHLSVFRKKSQSQQEGGLGRIMDEGQGILPGKPTPNPTTIPYQTVEIMGLRKISSDGSLTVSLEMSVYLGLAGNSVSQLKKILRSGIRWSTTNW